MSSQGAQKQRICRLQRKCNGLQMQLLQLQSARQELQLQSTVLSAWCEIFADSRAQWAAKCRGEHISCFGAPEIQDLQLLEEALLQQLAAVHLQPAPAPPALLDSVTDTVAPLGDPSALFRDLVARPMLPKASTVTAREVAMQYGECVQEMAAHLHQLDGPFKDMCRPLDKIKARLDRHMHLLASLVRAGREDVAEQFVSFHMETLQPLGPEFDQAAAAAVVIPSLGLTAQQEDVISMGMSVYLQLVNPVTREWQQLQQELADDLAGTKSQQSASSTSSSTSTSSNLADLLQPSELTGVTRQQRLSRLKVVIHKRYWLHMAATTWLFGSLTWTQLAQLATRYWPMGAAISAVVLQIQKQRQARLDKAASAPA